MFNKHVGFRFVAAWVWVLVGGTHCTTQTPIAPEIERAIPSTWVEGTTTEIEIRGFHFAVDFEFDFDNRDASRVNEAFRAWLGPVVLESVVFVSANVLKASVPATLPPGTYDLRVVDPAGREGSLAAAVVVEAAGAPLNTLYVEDAPGGVGQRVAAIAIDTGASTSVYAVLRTGTNAFVADAVVTWQVADTAVATVSLGSNGAQGVVTGQGAGSTTLQVVDASHAVTVPVEVRGACVDDIDCQSPCFGAATCVGGSCVLGSPTRDMDGDGAIDAACGGTDCDDDPGMCGANCHPGALERCDGLDNDCNAATADGALDPGLGTACDGGDADACTDDVFDACVSGTLVCDAAGAGNDNAEVVGDGVDQDCDGVDACYADLDNDGFGSSVVVLDTDLDCSNNTALTSNVNTDCDDNPGACGANCHPGALERCDGLDNDCNAATADGALDPGLGTACDGGDADACTDDVFDGCVSGILVCDAAGAGNDNAEVVADGIDQDCDGVDACYADLDNDGFGSSVVVSDTDLDCSNNTALTSNVNTDCDDNPGACGANCHPGALERCDGLDNDCNAATADGALDPGLGTACDGGDADACTDDVFDACVSGTLVCDAAGAGNDNAEVVADGIDQDCDGVDACYADLDNDGFGSSVVVSDTDLDCSNNTALTAAIDTDCDDGNASIYPGTTCNDGDGCTTNDVCHAGACRGYNVCGGSCGSNCNGGCGGSGNCCIQNCPGGNCATCEPGCSCDQACNSTSSCNMTCDFGSNCHLFANSVDDNAVMTCRDGASCFLECNSIDEECRLDCQGGALCMVSCNSVDDCRLDCPAGGTSCGGGTHVCNRPCP